MTLLRNTAEGTATPETVRNSVAPSLTAQSRPRSKRVPAGGNSISIGLVTLLLLPLLTDKGVVAELHIGKRRLKPD